KVRTIDAAEFLRARMDMHKGLARPRNDEQRVALRGHLAEPAANQNDQIGRLDARQELRIRPDAEVAGVACVPPVHQVAAAEGGGERYVEALGEARNRLAGGLRPA